MCNGAGMSSPQPHLGLVESVENVWQLWKLASPGLRMYKIWTWFNTEGCVVRCSGREVRWRFTPMILCSLWFSPPLLLLLPSVPLQPCSQHYISLFLFFYLTSSRTRSGQAELSQVSIHTYNKFSAFCEWEHIEEHNRDVSKIFKREVNKAGSLETQMLIKFP